MTTETITPNKANLLRWVRALESGEYTRGEGVLKNNRNQYCCLGVACDVAANDIGGRWTPFDNDSSSYVFVIGASTGEVSYLPSAVARWLGINASDACNPVLDGYSATCRNDIQGNSFVTIAAAVRTEFDLPTKEQDEHILAWIETLESGKYAQGSGRLKARPENRFCCLGVACDLAAKDGVGKWGENEWGETEFFTEDVNDQRIGALPLAVQSWLGINSPDPKLNGVAASDRNDKRKQTFIEIAAAARVEFGYPPKA